MIKHATIAALLLTAVFCRATNTPVYCQARVVTAMQHIWDETGHGTAEFEASFIVSGDLNRPRIYHEATTGEVMSQTIFTFEDTRAVFHVHPNGTSPFPSTPENNASDNGLGDTGMADKEHLDIYVVSQYGLSVYRWQTKTTEFVRFDLDWATTKGCK